MFHCSPVDCWGNQSLLDITNAKAGELDEVCFYCVGISKHELLQLMLVFSALVLKLHVLLMHLC